MSYIHLPAFHHTPFTSTLHEHKGPSINIWVILLTASFFFIVLSWYNFISALFAFYINTDKKQVDRLRHEVYARFIYALIWTVLAVLFYWILDCYDLLGSKPSKYEFHPTDYRDFSKDVTRDLSGDVFRALP